MRENYRDESLVSYSWLALLAMVVGGRLVFGLVFWGVWNNNWSDWLSFWQKPGFSYGGGLVTMLIMTVWYCRINGWKLWSFFEDIIPIIYFFYGFLMIDEWLRGGMSFDQGWWGMVVAILGLIIFLTVSKRYRSFSWYRSGKKGFGFFFTNTVIFLLSAIIRVIFFKDITVAVIYMILSLISLAGLFILGEVFRSLVVFNKRS